MYEVTEVSDHPLVIKVWCRCDLSWRAALTCHLLKLAYPTRTYEVRYVTPTPEPTQQDTV